MMNIIRRSQGFESAFRCASARRGSAMLLACAVTLASGAAHALWPFGIHGTMAETPQNLSLDEVVRARTASNGDLIVAGHFKGELTMSGGATLTSNGGQDVFVARITSGGRLVWVRQLGDAWHDTVTGLALDSANNVYVTGSFDSGFTAGGQTLVSHGGQDGYVVKLDANGVPKWAHAIGGGGTDRLDDVVVLPGDTTQIPTVSESLVLLGTYNDVAWLGESGLYVNYSTASRGEEGRGTDAFLVRLSVNDENGNEEWKWWRSFGSDRTTQGSRLVLDPDGRLHVAGRRGRISANPVLIESRFAPSIADGQEEPTAAAAAGWTITGKSGGEAHLISYQHYNKLLELSSATLPWQKTRDYNVDVVSQSTPDYIPPFLTIRRGQVAVQTTAAYNTSDAQTLRIELALYRGTNVYSPGISYTSAFPGQTSYSFNSFLSERPLSNEDLVLEYQKSDGNWAVLRTFPGGGAGGEFFGLYGDDAIVLNSSDPNVAGAFHSEAKFRLRMVRDVGNEWSWWHIAMVKITRIDQWNGFVLTFANPAGAVAPNPGSELMLSSSAGITDMAAASVPGVPGGVQLYLIGNHEGRIGYGSAGMANCPEVSGAAGAFVSGFTISGGSYTCQWNHSMPNAVGGALAPGDDCSNLTADNPTTGRSCVFLTGGFTGQLCLGGAAATLNSNVVSGVPSQDVFVAALDGINGSPVWATGGKAEGIGDTQANPPASIGGPGSDIGLAIARQSASSLYVGGRFEDIADMGPIDTLSSVTGADAFAFRLNTNGSFPLPQTWTVGVPITPPVGAITSSMVLQPEFFIAEGDEMVQVQALGELRWFSWARSPSGGFRLIPLQPTPEIEIRWRDTTELTSPSRITVNGRGAWPKAACTDTQQNNCYQVHTLGAPVEILPSSNLYQVMEVVNPADGASGATNSSGVFTAQRTGYASIVYVEGPSIDTTQYPVQIEVVRSMQYEATPGFQDGVEVEIGKKIVDTYHNEPGRSGFVLNALAFYDGYGTDAAYNRAARTGIIVPVNRYSSARPSDAGRELAVAWYRRKAKGVYWPERVVRYAPRWPFNPDKIVVASEQGGEAFGQAPLMPTAYPQARIYVQNDYFQPGFNPNDEHALMAPSATGSGVDAVFALRADFGSNLENDRAAPSDPYVLVKYFSNAVQEWSYRVYKVEALGGGFTKFRYSGVAGTTVSPPYPVRLLPACHESRVDGQAEGEPPPAPFYQDHKGQIWAASAGTGKVRYYYPMQPGFFRDVDYDNVNDLAVGECAPWLERLPKDDDGDGQIDGGNEPIAVQYDITWPENAPLLIAGETLLTPKRGLPDIMNQAAAKVVYDQLQDETEDADPSHVLAQVIDPLSSRWVRLVDTGDIELTMRTDGFYDIGGLPASLGERMYYDGMSRRLVLMGVFDETGVGEPKLLLNILSKRERATLKQLDGGDGTEESSFTGDCSDGACTWDQAVEALFRLSRNPQRIERVCISSHVNDRPPYERICDASRPYDPEIDMLAGYEDPNGNGVLQPLSEMGGAALTAGAAQGEGYLTLAFNDDESLGALPVSLEVIKVGCLSSTTSNPPIYAPYQGQINVISPSDIFDEQLVLRHSGDFGGRSDDLAFEWYFHPDENGTPPMPLPTPENGQMHGWIAFPVSNPNGQVEISIEGANIQTLSDNWYISRYRGLPLCGNQSNWSIWAGMPGATPTQPRAQLAQGWVKRVLARLNPFEDRVQDFGTPTFGTYASMLVQLGERYSGPIALNSNPDNLNSIGLIEAYTTVMRRAMQLSVDATPPVDYGPANAAILLVASRLVDFYTLLGNEAYADAQDPTIAIDSDGGTFSLSPTIFNFQNQLESLLDEELVLLRGRDDSHGPVAATPVYNRLFWNFTTGDGEVAYALSYNISDQDLNGVVDEYDARILFPQGHGDAWGHYLTAMDIYYNLLRHPYYTWNPQSEAVLVAGAPINVDFLDERQFAETAMYKARAGAEIVDLTYRKAYTEDPNGQYQGYEDTNPERAWGLSEWGRRAGMGAYFDWVTGNAILPVEDPNPAHVGIQRIERDNITYLDEIVAHYTKIQSQVDKADRGLNPLGLAKNVVPFDIDPSQLTWFNKTQFEQVWDRAMNALNNALKVWDYANQLSNQLRRTQESADDLWDNSVEQETDFANQLIEIFGYPYSDDIGGSGTYPEGYNGPDIYHYMYIDEPALTGTVFDFDTPLENLSVVRVKRSTGYYAPMRNGLDFFNVEPSPVLGGSAPYDSDCVDEPMKAGCPLGERREQVIEVKYELTQSPAFGTFFIKPEEWTGQRRAPGRIQQALQEVLMAQIALKQGILEYDKMRFDVEATMATLKATFNTQASNINVAHQQRQTLGALNWTVATMNAAAATMHRVAEGLNYTFKDTAHCIPDNLIVGLAAGGDAFAAVQCGLEIAGDTSAFVVDTVADGIEIGANLIEASKEDVSELSSISTMINDANLELFNITGEIDQLLREEPMLRAEIFARAQTVEQAMGEYRAALADGLRALEQLHVSRRSTAASTQQNRYKDMAFRIFRNDALQKYRAAFDLAARYVYLAAAAYDYETNLLGSNSKAGQKFLTNVVKERSIGQILNGTPMPGSPGLADTMAQLKANFDVLKGQMGFNNPQIETNRFSLRRELFRIEDGESGDEAWRRKLEAARVPNLWAIPEFRRYARPFAPESAGPQPGLVFEFSTNVTWGLNFFGWDLGPYDSSYNSSRFATRIRGAGVWFGNYNTLPLADDPNVYLIPVGADVLRAPDPLDFTVREWQVVDQAVPVPFPIGSTDLNQYDWLPTHTLDGAQTDIRRYPMMRAFHYSEPFDDSQVTNDSRLVGRSVWNRKWLLIIPGGTFLADPNEGLDTFINGARIPGGNGERDGHGVDDIRIFFKTYSYSGS